MTPRQQKVNSLLQREVAEYILTEGLNGITGVVTITGVDVTANLEYAKVFFSVIGQDSKEVLEILKSHIYEIQGTINGRLAMRKAPRISFVADDTGEYAAKIRQVMRGLHSK